MSAIPSPPEPEPEFSKEFNEWMWTNVILWGLSGCFVGAATGSVFWGFATLSILAFLFVAAIGVKDGFS